MDRKKADDIETDSERIDRKEMINSSIRPVSGKSTTSFVTMSFFQRASPLRPADHQNPFLICQFTKSGPGVSVSV